jgi:hypothetical protein
MLGPDIETLSEKKQRLARISSETMKKQIERRRLSVFLGKQFDRWRLLQDRDTDESFAKQLLDW